MKIARKKKAKKSKSEDTAMEGVTKTIEKPERNSRN